MMNRLTTMYFQDEFQVTIITVRNEVTKVMFLHVSVILFTEGGLPQ